MPDLLNGVNLGLIYDIVFLFIYKVIVMSELYELVLSINYGGSPNY